MRISRKRLLSIISVEHKTVLNEQAIEGTVLNYPGDNVYEYMSRGGKWYSRRKGRRTWMDLMKPAFDKTVANLNVEYSALATQLQSRMPVPPVPEPETVSTEPEDDSGGWWDSLWGDDSEPASSDPGTVTDTTPPSERLPFEERLPFDTHITSRSDGDAFRSWVNINKSRDDMSEVFSGLKDNKLGTRGSHTNIYIKRAYSAWGEEWLRDTGLTGDYPGEDRQDEASRFRVHPEFASKGSISSRERDALERGEEVDWLHICTETQCAQYVSDTLNQADMVTGNAWHRHRPQNLSYSAFSNLSPDVISKIEELFSEMNTNHGNVTSDAYNDRVRQIVKRLVPAQAQFSNLKIGDIVGLFHYDSDNQAKAFFEGGTGAKGLGLGANQRGTSFAGWSNDKVGSDESFVLKRAGKINGFGMNSHVGFVGAISSSGEPIIMHNIGRGGVGNVHATPLGKMSRTGDAIVWVDPAPSAVAGIDPGVFSDSDVAGSDMSPTALAEWLRLGINEDRLKKKHKIVLRESKEEDIKRALLEIKPSIGKLSAMLSVPPNLFETLLAAAILIADRESDIGSGAAYQIHPSRGNITQTVVGELNKLIAMTGFNPAQHISSNLDPSVGQTQIKWGTIEGGLTDEYRDELSLDGPHDLSDLTTAVLASVGLLAGYYNRAKGIGLSTTRPGVNSGYSWQSSGNACLDMAIAAYNGGPNKIGTFCGTEKIKSRCEPGDPDWVENYIPASTRFGMGYVDEIAVGLPSMADKVQQILGTQLRVNTSLRLPGARNPT